MIKQDFKDDFFEMMRLIAESDSLAFARAADGEANILKNNTIGNKDGWIYKRDKNLIFRSDLRKSLLCTDPGYIYGLSCTCCDEINHKYLLDIVKTNLKYLTFSNLLVNSNFKLFNKHFFETLKKSKKDIVICTNKKAKISNLGESISIKDFIPIPGNCVVYWEKHREYVKGLLDLKACSYSNTIFLFAVGPLTEILIREMWTVNQNNIYLDIGSTLDPVLFNRKSRNYHSEGDEFANRTCVW
jgi:hypothetical protein